MCCARLVGHGEIRPRLAGMARVGGSTGSCGLRALEALRGVLGETDQTDHFFTMGLDTSVATASAPAMPDTGGRGIEGFSAGTVLLGLSGALLLSGVLLLTRMARCGT